MRLNYRAFLPWQDPNTAAVHPHSLVRLMISIIAAMAVRGNTMKTRLLSRRARGGRVPCLALEWEAHESQIPLKETILVSHIYIHVTKNSPNTRRSCRSRVLLRVSKSHTIYEQQPKEENHLLHDERAKTRTWTGAMPSLL